jgi:hypothetical protein
MSTMNEPQAVREIHEIRERLYQQQKDWTDDELLEHYRRVGERYAKELGLEIVRHEPVRQLKKSA